MVKLQSQKFTEKWENSMYVCFFLIMSILMIIPYVHYGKIIADSDWLFHASRVEQIYRNLNTGHIFTFIASSTFHHTGVGSFLFYPTIFLYPWAALRFIFSPIDAFYIWYAIITFVAFVIAFYSMKAYSKNSRIAFIFALVYVLNSYRIYLGSWVFGEFCAASFLPLVFLGFYRVIFENESKWDWVILGTGMALLTYSHILSLFITMEIFISIILIYCIVGNLKKIFNLPKLFQIFRSIILWLMLTAPFIYLFVTNYVGQNVSAAYFGINMALLQSLPTRVLISFKNTTGWGIGTLLSIMLLVGWYPARKSKRNMAIYLLGIILFLMSTNLFPWGIFRNSILGIIQLPIRYLSFTCLFLAILTSEVLYNICKKINISYKVGIVLICLICFSTYGNMLKGNVNEFRTNYPTELAKPSANVALLNRSLLTNDNYEKQFMYSCPTGENDYYPEKSQQGEKVASIVNQTAYVDGKAQQIHSISGPNLITINWKKATQHLDLPVVCYHGTYVLLNGHYTKFAISNRGTVLLNNLSKYKHGVKIEVGFYPGPLYIVFIIISLVTWLVLLSTLLAKKTLKNINFINDK